MANRAEKIGGNRSGRGRVEPSTENSFPRRVGPGSQATSRELISNQHHTHNGTMTNRTSSSTNGAAAAATAAHERRKRKRLNPCCTCYRTSTCYRKIFAKGDGTSQGCECRSAGRKCTTCACKSKCKNLHQAPTPRSTAPSGITSFFNRNRTEEEPEEPEPEPDEPEPESDPEEPESNTTNNNLQTPHEDDTPDDGADDDEYLTATQNSAESEEEEVEEDEAEIEVESIGAGDESEEEDGGGGEDQEPEAATTVEPDSDNDEADGSDTEADDVLDTFPPEEGADLPDYIATPTDDLLNILYGDHPHENDGCHLDGGIDNDARWQRYWRRVVGTKAIWYRNPQGRIGKLFIRKLTEIIRGVRERQWNSERIIVFPAVILYKAAGITAAKDIRARIESRIKLWDEGRYSALIEDMEVEAALRRGPPVEKSEEETFRDYNARVLSGHLRSACRTLTNRGFGGTLSPDGTCTKSGRPVMEVLQSKHPPLREPSNTGQPGGACEEYDQIPTTVPLIVSTDTVEEVALKLSGSAGPGGLDSETCKAWLLGYGQASGTLRSEIASLTTWIANQHPPWAAYRALMACRLVALDKQPGTRPVGIGELYRRLMAKCVLHTVGGRATNACGNYNLCVGLKAGIEGGVHVIREAMKEAEYAVERAAHANRAPSPVDSDDSVDEEDVRTDRNGRRVRWEDDDDNGLSGGEEEATTYPGMQTYDPENPHGTLCIDARNGFNELNRKAMLWTVRHLWAAGARFAFNCYRHSAQLVVQHEDRQCTILQSREGVTQGDPLSMVLYGLAMVPLAKYLREAVPTVIQPWYADDCAMSGGVKGIAEAMDILQRLGPSRGYYPEPTKSIFVCRQADRRKAKELLEDFEFIHRDGVRYIGGFIGTEEARNEWLAPQIEAWEAGVKTLARVAKRFPQTAYAGLTKSLQTEWTYLQRVVPDIANSFAPIEEAITTNFLPALFDGEPPDRDLTQLPVRMAGMGIPDPWRHAQRHYQTSRMMTEAVNTSLMTGAELDTSSYGRESTRILMDHRAVQEVDMEWQLNPLLEAATKADERRMRRSRATGAWLTATPSDAYGTALSCMEFRDAVRIRNGMIPLGLPAFCDGCRTARFTVGHAFQCKQGGLVRARHEEVAGEWHQLCAQALTPSAVSDEPTIPTYQNQQGEDQSHRVPELRGDVAVHGFWTRGTTAVFDIRVTDTDANSYRNTDPAKVLKRQEKEKKDKYGETCRQAHMHFTPLVFSVDGMEGEETTAAQKRLASRLAAKWKRKYSQVCGFIRSRLAFTLVRSASRCLRGTRNNNQRPESIDWAQQAGMRLYTQLF